MSNVLDEQMITEVLETNAALDELVFKLNAVQSSLSGVQGSFECAADSMEVFQQHQIAFQNLTKDLSVEYKHLESVLKSDCIENVILSLTGMEKALQFDSILDFTEKIGSSISKMHIFTSAIGGNVTALTELQKNMPMAYKSLCNFFVAFSNFKQEAGKEGFGKGIVKGFDTIQNRMTGIQKGLIGVAAGFIEFFAIKDSMHDLLTGTDAAIANLTEMAIAVTGAGVAFSMAFGAPVGIALALTTAIVGIGAAFMEVEVEQFGERIKNTLTNPGGVAIEDLTNSTKNSIEKIGEGFSLISEKADNFDSVGSNIKNVTFEIDKIRTSMAAGVISAEEAIPHLIGLYGQLGDAISAKIGAAGDVLLATFAPGSISAQAFEYAGVNAESTRTAIVQAMDEQQKAVYDLTQELTHLQETDPTNPRIPELLAQIAAIEQGSSELKVSLGNLQVVASQGISWETYINDEGLNLEAFNLELEGIINAGLNVKQSAESDFAATITAAESLGDPALVEKIQAGLPQALQYVDEQISAEALQVTNTMQTELVGNIENVITEAEARWAEMTWYEKLFSGFDSADAYAQNAVLQYKTNYIDPLSQNIEAEYSKLGIDGAGWADEASQKIIDSMFDVSFDTDYSTGMTTTTTTMNENWREIIESSTNGIYDLMKEKGVDAVSGLNTGIGENSSLTGEEITKWMDENVLSVVQSELDSHSPSKVMEEFGKYSVLGYNKGIEDYTPLTTIAMLTYMGKVTQVFSAIYGRMYSYGANAMLGIYAGLESKENLLYTKAQTIADNLKNIMRLDVTVNTPKQLTGLTYQPVEQFQYNYEAPDLSTSIAEKVEVAVSNAMVPYLEQLVQNTKDALSKEIAVNIGDKEIARANIRGKQEMGMRLIT